MDFRWLSLLPFETVWDRFLRRRPVPTPPPVPVPVPDPIPAPDHSAVALLAAHNAIREQAGLKPLGYSPQLEASATRHALWMAQVGRMAHSGIGDGSFSDRIAAAGYNFAAAGENIAEGYRDLTAVMAGWMADPPHRANILSFYTEAGCAVAHAADGTPYYCVDFGTPMG
jgi:uncharacterized protein YkwD